MNGSTTRDGSSGIRAARFAALAVLLGGCGGLSTPGLLVGDVAGRILGASPGAYAYPLGRPDLKSPVKVDGTWRLEGVPRSVTAIVLWDGNDRAELVPIVIASGAEVQVADRHGAGAGAGEPEMPLAGALLASVDPEGGAIPWAPSFSVRGTDHADLRPISGGCETIYPLPAGAFVVEALLDGFAPTSASVLIVEGATSAAAVTLPIDAGAPAPGCGSTPGCENGLVCEVTDGRCYVCTGADASACGAGGACDSATGLCVPAGPIGDLCAACTADAECGAGACVIPEHEAAGWCVRRCDGDADCPAGFKCGDEGRCRAPEGCLEWIRTMGSTCVSQGSCEEGLAEARCVKPVPAVQAGYCTAPCASDADCQIGTGVAATMVCAAGLCALP